MLDRPIGILKWHFNVLKCSAMANLSILLPSFCIFFNFKRHTTSNMPSTKVNFQPEQCNERQTLCLSVALPQDLQILSVPFWMKTHHHFLSQISKIT